MKEKRMKCSKNAGMSLIELVVVVLILGIVSVGGFIGIQAMSRFDTTGVAGKIESLMDRTRMQVIANDDIADPADDTKNIRTFLRIKMDGNKYYGVIMCKDNTGSTRELDIVELGNSSIKLKLVASKDGSVTETDLATNFVDFYFNKSDGSFATDNDKMRIEIKGSNPKTIYLVKATGRSLVE